jgi:hypothetical protein
MNGLMQFEKLSIEPARNPAVLDTATWNREDAARILRSLPLKRWNDLFSMEKNKPTPLSDEKCTLYPGSYARIGNLEYALALLQDHQHVFVARGTLGTHSPLGKPIGRIQLNRDSLISFFPADAETLDRYVHTVRPDKAPRPMGGTPRLGTGARMSTAVWPGVFRAMERYGFAANAIQNSLRELNLLEDLLSGLQPKANYLFGFGSIQEGHTGSTFEGLWTYGVLEALKQRSAPSYGADADHIMVKRGPDGLERAKEVIDASRRYTFYTLDVSDILEYHALSREGDTRETRARSGKVPETKIPREVYQYHGRRLLRGGVEYALSRDKIASFFTKYRRALDSAQALHAHLLSHKSGAGFDLELSFDEHPPEIPGSDCLTGDRELIFILLEAQRRALPLTHVAPNVGVEKGVDYRGAGGLAGLEDRVRTLHRIAQSFGVMLDFHSGDDLTTVTRQVLGRATKGQCHFKISPLLQQTFAEVLFDLHDELFDFWWRDTLAYAKREALAGSAFAARAVTDFEGKDEKPSPGHPIFRHFCFETVGRRDERGRFLNRERFYDLSREFHREYTRRVVLLLGGLAADLFR